MAALGPAETAQVGELIKQLKSEGLGIFLISHDIHNVFDLADRVTVMKNGQVVGTGRVEDMTKDEVLGMIILGKCPPGAIPGRERWRTEGRGRPPPRAYQCAPFGIPLRPRQVTSKGLRAARGGRRLNPAAIDRRGSQQNVPVSPALRFVSEWRDPTVIRFVIWRSASSNSHH